MPRKFFKMRTHLTPFFLIVFCGIFPKAFAQQTNADTLGKTHRLSEVIIQDNRLQIPFSKYNRDVVVLDEQVIRTLPVQSVNELLTYVAGVDLRQRGPWGGQADISIHGGTFDQTLVLLNGMRVTDPQTGHNMMNLPIDPSMVERIEVLKGATASAYGINALSGAINIITKQPRENTVVVHLTGGTSFEKDSATGKLYAGTAAGFTASFVKKGVRHLLAASTQQTSGHRYNTAMNNYRGFYQNAIELSPKSNLRMMGGFVYNDFGANGFYSPPGDKNAREIVQTGIAAIKGEFGVTPGWTMRPNLSYKYNFDDYIFIKTDPGVYRNRHHTHVVEAALNNSVQTGANTLGFGLEYRSETIKSNSLGQHRRDNWGLYAAYGFVEAPKLTVNAGAYMNYSEHFGWQLLPSIDAGFQVSSQWRLFANAGTGTRVPTYTDWYYKGPSNIGNSELEPENSFHAEMGSRFSNSRLQASATVFYRKTIDFIDWVKDDVNAPWQPQNFQEIQMPGFSLQADYQLFADNPSLLAGLSYTRLEPRLTGSKSEYNFSRYALENLKNQWIARFTGQLSGNWSATLAARYHQRVNYKDYVLVDAKVQRTFGAFSAHLAVNNLLNETYVEAGAVPLPGRWLNAGVRWTIGQKPSANQTQ